MRTHLTRYLMLTILAFLVPHASAEEETLDLEAKALWSPPVKTSYWGNIDGDLGLAPDGKVNLKDLIELAKNFQNARERYGRSATSVLIDMTQHYNKKVPKYLRDLPVEIGRGILGHKSPSAAKGTKAFGDIPVGIGKSIRFSERGDLIPGPQIYDAPRSMWTDVETQELEMYTSNEEYKAEYIDNYLQETEFRAWDVNAEIKYAAFNGSLSSGFQRNTYSDMTTHKYMIKDSIDFGWWELPERIRNEDQILPAFQAALIDPASEADLVNTYGTHYVSSAHLASDFIIEVTIHTRTRHDQKSLRADVAAAYSGLTTYASFSGSAQSASSRIEQNASITITITTHGGPNPIRLPDGTDIDLSNPLVFTPSDNLMQKIPDMVSRWRNGWEGHDGATPSNAAVKDWYIKPIAEFIPTTVSAPFSRSEALRGWFRRFAEFSEMRDKMKEVLFQNPTSGEFGYIPPFSYLGQMPVPAGFPFNTLKDYHIFVYKHYNDAFADLLAVGRRIYSGEQDEFLESQEEQDKFQIIPPMVQPLTITKDGATNCSNGRDDGSPDGREYSPYYCIPNVDVTDSGSYTLELQGKSMCVGGIMNITSLTWLPPGSTDISPCNPSSGGLTRVSSYRSCTTVDWPCYQRVAIARNSTGLIIKDAVSGKIIGYACGGDCSGVDFSE